MAAKHTPKELVELAHKHLWIYFSQLRKSGELAIIERGEGSYVFDNQGKRYIDGLAGLFLTNVGHGRTELADAAHEQMSRLHFFPLWSHAHPAAIELAAKLAELAP
ncbi:MAG TPA: aminotransferase class III-fold pyridoxal phosphate-dependent enzyme, partial [Myxococcota bacterium]